MKSLLILLVTLLIANNVDAQNWNPFVLNQNSYYKQQYDNLSKVESFSLNSVHNEGSNKVLYFNAKFDLDSECSEKLIKELANFYWLTNPDKIDSLVQVHDSVLFITDNYEDYNQSEIDTFIFKPWVRLNESWVTNGITIQCTNLCVQEVLGIQDSIKAFTCFGNGYDGIEFILSKTFGLVKFLPLQVFLYGSEIENSVPYFELIGYSINEMSVGYVQPDFSDYFHLKTGDMLYWRNYSEPIDITIPSSTSYYLDSITYSFISPDSVYYNYKREFYDKDGEIEQVEDQSVYYVRKHEGLILRNQISWFALMPEKYSQREFFFIDSLYFRIENNDTITYLSYQFDGLLLNSQDCSVGTMFDFGLSGSFSTREGETFQSTFSWGENSTTLIGSVINGIEYGSTDIPTSINTTERRNFRVYPNPVQEILTVQFKDPSKVVNSVSLINAFGQTLNCHRSFESSQSLQFNMNDLLPGIYFVKVNYEDKSEIVKVIKN